MTTPEKNTAFLPMTPLLFANRAIWLSVTLAAFAAAYFRFSYKFFVKEVGGKKPRSVPEAHEHPSQTHTTHVQSQTQVQSGIQTLRMTATRTSPPLAQMLRLAWLEFVELTRGLPFRLIVASLFMMFFLYQMLWTPHYYSSAPQLPLTWIMTGIRLPVGMFVILLLMIYTGEVLHKDRITNFWHITDALPVQTWMPLGAKLMAMLGVAFVLAAMMMLSGLTVQALQGFWDIRWDVYVIDIFTDSWLAYCQIIALVFVLHSLIPNRFAAHAVGIGFFLFCVISEELGIVEQLRLLYAFNVSEGNYSDLNAYNMFNHANVWFALTWTSLAVMFVVVGLAAWQRGVIVRFGKRFPTILRGITPVRGAVMACCGLAFVGGEYTLYRTINLENGFKTRTEERSEAAAYERAYKHIKSAPQPKIINLTATVELYPQDRRASVLAAFTLKNFTSSPIDTLHLEYEDFCRMQDIRVEGASAQLVKHDDEFRHIIIKLPRTLLPNDTMSLKTASKLTYRGFTQGEQQGNLTFSGKYLRWDECFPTLGYNSARELLANRHRREHGLEPIASRLPLIGDSVQHHNTVWSDDADCLHYRITLGTAADQTPLTSGKKVQTEQRNGRNYATFEGFGTWNGAIVSAQFTQTQRPCSLASGKVVNIEMYRHAEHPYNADLMLRSAEEAVQFYAARFGLQSPATLRIVEIPHYTEESFAFANTIAIPEKHGWTADARKPEDANYARYLVARQIAASLLADYILPANVQGAPVLTRTLPQYAALRFLAEHRYDSFVREHLSRRTTRYFKGSGKEPNAEPPLLLADDDNVPDGEDDLNGYVSVNKGGAVLFGLAEQCGIMKFDSLLKVWFSEASGGKSFATASDFYGFLRTAFSRENPALLPMLNESFEERIQHSLRLESVSLQDLATQESELTLNIHFSKRAYRGDGTSTALPVNDRIACAVQDANGNNLWRGTIPLTANEATVRLRLPRMKKQPSAVVLDPDNTLLEGSRTDNRKTM